MPFTAQETRELMERFCDEMFVQRGHIANVNTDHIEAAITNLTAFIEANAVAINNAFPAPFKSNATQGEKWFLYGMVSAKLGGL